MKTFARTLLAFASVFLPLAAFADPTLSAKLIDPEAKAGKGELTVEVTVAGIRLIDAGAAMEQPRTGEGHLHYRLDDGPVVATTATKLSFHGLGVGTHRLEVKLAANDHKPLGPEQALSITVPSLRAQSVAQPPGSSATRSE